MSATDNNWIPLVDKDGNPFEFNSVTGEIRYPDDEDIEEGIGYLFDAIDDMESGWAVDGSDPASIGIDQGDSFDAEGRHLPRGTRPAWDANGRYLPLDSECEPQKTCPDCKGSGEYQGLGAPEKCKNCNGLGQV